MTFPATKNIGIALAMMAALSACSKKESAELPPSAAPDMAATDQADAAAENVGPQAVAQLSPTQGNSVSGTVAFAQATGGVKVTVDLQGLAPGKHGFHIHDKGDCSAPDGSSAGDHYNPHGAQHGAPDSGERHAGDFGNVDADP